MDANNIIENNAVETLHEAETLHAEAADEEIVSAAEGDRQQQEPSTGEATSEPDEVQHLLNRLGVTESVATSARVIVQSLRDGSASSESIVKLVVQALRHDEDLKDAETQGYLRGRNEVIAAASTPPDDKSPQPLNFPIYTKRSFWDK